MGKTKPRQKKNKDLNSAKQQLHAIKNGSVKKDKNSKFKNTPGGKVALINNSKAQNKNTSPQKSSQKDAGLKNNQNLSKNIVKQSKQNPAKNKQNSPNGGRNKPANKEIKFNIKKIEEYDDSDFDIDEKIIAEEGVGRIKRGLTEEFEDFKEVSEEESDTTVPNILGKSLEDTSDEEDEDFYYEVVEDSQEESSEDDDSEDESSEFDFGDDDDIDKEEDVRTFKVIKSKKNDDNKDDKYESDRIKLSQLLMKAKKDEDESDEDDEDFEEEEEEENYDNGKYSIEDEVVILKGEPMFTKSKLVDELLWDSDVDDDYEDESDEEENEDSRLGLKALLGNSIADEDDDDDDFNEEDEDDEDEDEDDEDDDISDEDEDDEENIVKVAKEKAAKASDSKNILKGHKQVQESKKKLSPEEQEEIDKRTIIIHNINKEAKEIEIKKVFGKFGPINNLRFTSVIPHRDSIMFKKIVDITKNMHPRVTTVTAHINYKSQVSAQKALSMNGRIFEANYIQVQIVHALKEVDPKKAVFIGNLKLGLDSNIIWKYFRRCGEIRSVNLMREKTGETSGFGYIIFKTEHAAAVALNLNGLEIINRPLQVRPCGNVEPNKKGEKRVSSHNNDDNPRKKFKNNLEKPVVRKAESEANINKHQKLQKKKAKSGEQSSILFQGQKAELSKNKKKPNKFDKKKKKMAQKLTVYKLIKPVKV